MKPTRLAFLALALLLVATTLSAAHDSYVLHFGGNRNTMISGSLQDFLAIRGQLDGDYLWVRRGGRTYVITDHARLAEMWDYFAPQRALRPEQKEVERQ